MRRADELRIERGVAVVGSTTVDRNIVGGVSRLALGGVTTYAGLAYRRRGLPTWVVTRIAACQRPLLARLAAAGIRLNVAASSRSTRFINRLTGNRRTQQMPCRAAPIRWAQVEQVLERVDAVHLGPLHPLDIERRVFELLRGRPLLVVADLQGLARRVASGRVLAGAADALPAALAAADVVKTDADELEPVLAALGRDLPGLMERFAIREWVVTDGDRGGRVFLRGGRRHAYACAPAASGGDPTGAGDVFLAAYAAARFAAGRAVGPACVQAAAEAALHVAGGARRRQALTITPDERAAAGLKAD
ncbi:MAG: PfkB family carbohydrate kinase [Desulfobacterales bacterium]|jgi:sugar/nucleoside kinase (ribokinase family)|nr:PfkB family carbohydrate kinase [Desulfobacterales bacterium]